MNYYVSGFPCSDKLYHDGIPGMKWHVRRFQNYDGSLTDAGYERYYGHPRRNKRNAEVSDTGTGSAKAALSAAGKAIKSGATSAKNKIGESYKNRHPELMSDDELRNRIARINMEISYKRAVDQNKFAPSRAKRVAGDIIESSAKRAASDILGLINTGILKSIDRADYERRKDYEDRLSEEREKRQERRDISRENRQERRDISRENRQEQRDISRENRERDREHDSMGWRFEDYVKRTMPSDFSRWTEDDWNNFDTYTNIRTRMREFEGRSDSKRNKKK